MLWCCYHRRLHPVEVRARERMGTLHGMDFDVLQEGSGGVAVAWHIVFCESTVLTVQTNVTDFTVISLFNHCVRAKSYEQCKSVHVIDFHEPGEWPRHCCSANDKARGVSPNTTSVHKKINERVKPWFFRFSQLSFLQAVIGRAVAVSEQAVIVGDSVRNFLGRVEIS